MHIKTEKPHKALLYFVPSRVLYLKDSPEANHTNPEATPIGNMPVHESLLDYSRYSSSATFPGSNNSVIEP